MLVAKPGLVVTVDADGLRIEHPLWDYAIRTCPPIIEVLYLARTPVAREKLIAGLRSDAVTAALDQTLSDMIEMGILEPAEGGPDGHLPELPRPWNFWGADTWLFHSRAHRTRFLHSESDIWFEKVSRPEPPLQRAPRYARAEHERDLSPHRGTSAIAQLFGTRRTRRDFADCALSLTEVGQLVSETFRVRDITDADYFGVLPLKSYPSSGGRHEIDVYVVSLNISELPSGFYYYDDYRDVLVDTRLELDTTALDACLAHQGMVTTSAALVIGVCQAERLAWKYRSPRGYLDAYINAGHAMQNAILYAESLGLGAWLTTAIDTYALSSLLSLGASEFPIAALALGCPRDSHETRVHE